MRHLVWRQTGRANYKAADGEGGVYTIDCFGIGEQRDWVVTAIPPPWPEDESVLPPAIPAPPPRRQGVRRAGAGCATGAQGRAPGPAEGSVTSAKRDQFRFIRLRYTFGDVTLIVQKGSNKYNRWYVLDESGKYLSKGFDSQTAAVAAAGSIARTMTS